MLRFYHSFRRFLLCILLIGLTFFLLPFSSESFHVLSTPQMKVGITLAESSLRLSFAGDYRLVDQSSGSIVEIPAGEYKFFLSRSGNSHVIEIQDLSGRSYANFSGSLYLKALASPADSSFKIINAQYGQEYRGELEISIDGSGHKINAVNIIDLENYLRGVIAGEMPSAWGNYGGMEALKAQAVVARTYALYEQGLQRHSGYHLCDAQHCQVYGGKGAETFNTDQALAETRGEILTYNGEVIEPFYNATNGGFTEQPQNVWLNPVPYIRSEPDFFDDPANPLGIREMIIHPSASWEADIPLEKISSLLISGGYTDVGEVEHMEIASSFQSGRVNELVIQGTGGKVSLFKEKSRTLLGLKSQLFTIREEPETRVWIASAINGLERKERLFELEGKWAISGKGMPKMLLGENFTVLSSKGHSKVPYNSAFIFEGRGLGHGIGMSQNGAYNRSRQGHSYTDILSFYYPGTAINTIEY